MSLQIAMGISEIFFDRRGVVRSGWRALFFLVLFLVVTLFWQIIATQFMPSGSPEGTGLRGFGIINLGVNTLLAAGTAFLCAWLFEKLPFKAFGASFSSGWWKHLLIGAAIGFFAIFAAIAPALISGRLQLAFTTEPLSIAAPEIAFQFVFFAFGAAFEEALFRGYILQTFARSGLAWFAIALTSLIFGLVHMANPSADAISTINTVLAGIVFSLAYLRTLDLWLPFGLHFMWNFAQGSIFGIEVSGLKNLSPISLLVESDHGPRWLTGETYGIEASLFCTVALILAMAAIYLLPGLKRDPELAAIFDQDVSSPPVS